MRARVLTRARLRMRAYIDVAHEAPLGIEAGSRPRAVGVHAEDVIRRVLVEPPALVEPDGRSARAGGMLHCWRHVLSHTRPDWLPEGAVSDDHAVFIVADAAAEGDGRVLRVAHGLRERCNRVGLVIGQDIGEDESSRHTRHVGALHRPPCGGKRYDIRRWRPDGQVVPLRAWLTCDQSEVRVETILCEERCSCSSEGRSHALHCWRMPQLVAGNGSRHLSAVAWTFCGRSS